MLSLEIEGTDIHNHYDLWVIPAVEKADISGAYIFDEVNDEAESLLKQGKTVLILPDLSKLETLSKDSIVRTSGAIICSASFHR